MVRLANENITPRNRPGSSSSPLASSLPFDWDAAIHRRPPPYSTPASQRRLRKSIGIGASGNGTPDTTFKRGEGASAKRVISNWASQLIFDLQEFPHNRLPDFQNMARVLGALLHCTHLVVRYTKLRRLKDEDIGWEDMLGEINMPGAPVADSWMDWATPASIILISMSLLNAAYVFTRIKYYHLFFKPDLVNSPSAEFVDRHDLDYTDSSEPPPVTSRTLSQCIRIFWILWSVEKKDFHSVSCIIHNFSRDFLLGITRPVTPTKPTRKVQRLSIWSPERGEMQLFIIYSPLHAMLWQAVTPGNWIMMVVLLGITSAQLYLLNEWHVRLLKDKEIIAGEVMSEYNQKFVYPHIMRVKRDACVMTNEAETINFRR
ncbi:hypothetical protein BU17DRAFT_49773 [Hysterangium stoloniferum]|nr:hypothetical protein BU17DRAFT_49773 [Hysterangium stoloniferum]